jgi:hypothetical protein
LKKLYDSLTISNEATRNRDNGFVAHENSNNAVVTEPTCSLDTENDPVNRAAGLSGVNEPIRHVHVRSLNVTDPSPDFAPRNRDVDGSGNRTVTCSVGSEFGREPTTISILAVAVRGADADATTADDCGVVVGEGGGGGGMATITLQYTGEMGKCIISSTVDFDTRYRNNSNVPSGGINVKTRSRSHRSKSTHG